MAWQYVGGTSGAGTSSGYTVSLSGTLTGGIASSPSAGDLVVVFSGFGNTASSAPAISGNSSGAYQAATAAQHVNDTWDTEFRSFYQVMGSTPDTTLTVTRTTNAAYGGATTVHVWRGVHQTNPFIGAATSASGINTSLVNPPAYNPAVTGCLIIAGGAGTQATTGAAFTGFTGMANFLTQKGDGTTSDIDVAMASYAYAGVSFDPPIVSGGTGGNTSSSWAGVTIAFRPFDYNLVAQGGSYSVSGGSANLYKSKTIVASGGSYVVAGQTANITYVPNIVGYTLTCNGGSYSVTGSSANLARNRVLTSNGGSYTQTGANATLLRSKRIVASGGSYTLTGQSASILRSKRIVASGGSYTVLGSSASIFRNRVLTAEGGSYTITGQDAVITYALGPNAYSLVCLGGSYSVTGSQATISRNRHLTTQGGSYTVSGGQAVIMKSKYLQGSGGSYTITGASAAISRNRTLIAQGGTYQYTGQQVTILKTGQYWPMPSEVLLGVMYGPTGVEYTGTLDIGKKFRIDINTGNIVMVLDGKKVMSL